MLRVNPKLLRRYEFYKLTKSIEKNRMKSIKYGKSFVLTVKKTGVMLDAILPCTFGLITLGLVKVFGNKEVVRFSWE